MHKTGDINATSPPTISYRPMRLGPCKKIYDDGTQRARLPVDTLSFIEPRQKAAGITRVADITSLDRIGIPVYSAIRPSAEDGAISVYNGKGATPIDARISAIMEGIERYSSEMHGREVVSGIYSKIARNFAPVDPADLILPRGSKVDDISLPWYPCFDIVQEEEVLVPAHAVFHPVPRNTPPLFRTNTNGLASGNTLEEAVFHALAEVIERDAWSLAEAAKDLGPRVEGITDGKAAWMLEQFAAAGVSVVIRDITSEVGIPTIAAASDDERLHDPALLTLGMGTHTSGKVALIRALTEVAQSRLTQIHGAREDTTVADLRRKMGYDRVRRMNRRYFESRTTIPYTEVPSLDTDDFLDDIRIMTGALEKCGMDRVLVADLTRPEIGVPVVRVIVPGLEVYAMDNERIGERCRDAARRGLSRAES